MKLGAHQSIAGGYTQSLERIKNIGGNCLQIFSSSPRGWNFAKVTPQEVSLFLNHKSKININPVYFHASYLVNLADSGRISSMSKLSLIAELSVVPKLKIKGSIVHLGSFKAKKTIADHNNNVVRFGNGRGKNVPAYSLDKINNNSKLNILINNINEVLDKTSDESLFIIENAGNRKIGKDLDEIAEIIKQVNNLRVRVCLDTCHLHSAGYDLTTKENLDKFLSEFDKLIGLNKLELFHINDSRDPFNSGCDRHENIGKETVGIETFRLLLNHPKTKNLPFIVETPGFDDNGPDKQNLDILKGLISE